MTFVGELGWELYCPTEYGAGLWRTLWRGRAASTACVAGGYRAIDSLRLEKGYRVWAADITPDDTPLRGGLGFCVRKDGGFIGADALGVGREPAAPAAPTRRRLRCLVLDDPRSVALGNEPVRVDGEIVGRVTSGGYGYTVGALDRLRLPARARSTIGRGRRGRHLRRVGRRRGRARAAVRPEGRADPGVSPGCARAGKLTDTPARRRRTNGTTRTR